MDRRRTALLHVRRHGRRWWRIRRGTWAWRTQRRTQRSNFRSTRFWWRRRLWRTGMRQRLPALRTARGLGLTLPCDFGVCNPIGNGFLGTGLPSNPGPYQFALPIYLLGDLLYGFNGNPPTLSRNPLAYQSCLNSALSDRRWCKAAITVAYGIPAGIVDVGCFGVGGPGAEILCLNLTQGSLLVPAAIGWNGCNAAYQQAAGSCSTQRMGPP